MLQYYRYIDILDTYNIVLINLICISIPGNLELWNSNISNTIYKLATYTIFDCLNLDSYTSNLKRDKFKFLNLEISES